jgi:uncharacterized protein (TIGR00251 family)
MGPDRAKPMSDYDKCCKTVPGGVEISVKVVPGASRDRIAGVLGDAIKIQVAAPPEKGKANQAVIRLLAELLQHPAREISVVQGPTSPRKTILVRGMSRDAAMAALSVVQK